MKKQLLRLKRVLRATFSNAFRHDLPLHSAAIAFYTIFSLAPLLLIMVSLSRVLLSEQIVRDQLHTIISNFTEPQISESIIEMIRAYARTPASITAYVIATVLLIFGATTVITQLKTSLNTIWHIKPKKGTIAGYIMDRFISLVVIFFFTALFVASLLLDATLPLLMKMLNAFVPAGMESTFTSALSMTHWVLTLTFFMVLFRVLPDINLPWKDILIGSLFTSVLFLTGKYLIGLYLSNPSIQISYRAAGSFVIFLIWMYYNIQIMLLGAEFTYAYSLETENKPDVSGN